MRGWAFELGCLAHGRVVGKTIRGVTWLYESRCACGLVVRMAVIRFVESSSRKGNHVQAIEKHPLLGASVDATSIWKFNDNLEIKLALKSETRQSQQPEFK